MSGINYGSFDLDVAKNTDSNGNITDEENGKKTVDENGYYLRTANDTVIGNIEPKWKIGS